VQAPVWGALPMPTAGEEASIPPSAVVPSGPTTPARLVTQEIDYGWRDKGYTIGAFKPVESEALTAP
jgi:hypothetical protein